MQQKELDAIVEDFKAKVAWLSERDLINAIATPFISTRPDLYIRYLPFGLCYVSGPRARNCYDYAQGCRGLTHLPNTHFQGQGYPGDIIVYFLSNGRNAHAGKFLGNGRVISQWGEGAVFEHEILQIPDIYGRSYDFIKER